MYTSTIESAAPLERAAVLANALSDLLFYNEDTARASDEYVYEKMLISYMEPDNVTCARCRWSTPGVSLNRGFDYLWLRQNGSLANPPLGIRSAPPLGGLGAGSVMLMADGSFRGFTIFNQGPAGSGKYGLVDDAVMAARVNGRAKALRTHPPQSLAGSVAGVEALHFSGAYPATRLVVEDATLLPPAAINQSASDSRLSLFGYSILRPGAAPESWAHPAVTLSLQLTNRGSAPMDLDFMFALPLGGWTDCSRDSGANATVYVQASTPAECMRACTAASRCASWEMARQANASCRHNAGVPLTAHRSGSTCGVRGHWTSGDRTRPHSQMLTWTQRPLANGPAMGDVTLQGVGGHVTSVGVADDLQDLFQRFEATGSLRGGSDALRATGVHGAVAVSARVPAGDTQVVSITFAWHFPDRDYDGQIVGNAYAALFEDSAAVAQTLGSEEALTSVVRGIHAHHSAVAHADNPAPVWLKDQLLNQWSHLSMLMWLSDGRMREYESWSCDDVDSVHNDYQRHLLYLWGVPRFEEQKMDVWGTWAQASDGHVEEVLAAFNHGPLDQPGGRIMGDTTSLYVLEAYELYRHTGNATRLRARWPAVRKAIEWCMRNANEVRHGQRGEGGGGDSVEGQSEEPPFGLPQYLTNTYDHFHFERHRAVAYNAHVYLTALEAATRLALAVGDHATHAKASSALELSSTAVLDPDKLWNRSHGFWRAHTASDWAAWVKATNASRGSQPTYKMYNNGYLLAGDDLHPPTAQPPSACRALCDATDLCRGYSYERRPAARPDARILCYTKAAVHLVRTDGPWNANQIFTDTLYGQMLSHHHFDGHFTAPASHLQSHLAFEWARNQDAFGMRVISDPVDEDSIWLNGPPTWSYLQLALGALSFTEALEPLRRLSENIRGRLKDLWNLRGLLHTDGSLAPVETNRSLERGAPREQGHYAFMLTDLFLLPLLSGQVVDLPNGQLILQPPVNPPYVLPVLLAGAEGSLECRRPGRFTLRVAFGRLQLPPFGLRVNGSSYARAIRLEEGQHISWEQ